MSYLPYLVAVWLLVVGLYGVATSRNLLHLTQCLAVAQSSSYVLLLTVGFRSDAIAPVFTGVAHDRKAVDPIVQALTLTDVVVSVTLTGLLLAISVQVYKQHHSLDPSAGRDLRG